VTLEIRPINSEEFEAFALAGSNSFGEARLEHVEDERAILDFDRTLAAFDGEEIVATAAILDFDLSVPGSQLPAAGISWVSVRPTHRRQGLLTRMMERQLSDVRDRGESIAALWASESIIYGRFGYGVAALGSDLRIDRTFANLAHGVDAPGRCRMVSREQALSTWPAIYAGVAKGQPGMYSRSENWWKHHSLRYDDPKKAKEATFYVQYEEEDRPLGYVRYTIKPHWRDNLPDGTLNIEELVHATHGAYAALWNYIFGVDLMSTFASGRSRIDEPLLWMLDEPRRLVSRSYDALWLRLVDVPSALEARRYPTAGKIVIDVDDSFCPWNAGRYELQAGPDGAICKSTKAKPDLALTAADLATVYLGGPRIRALAQAGRVDGDADAIKRADRLFSWDITPWCPEVF